MKLVSIGLRGLVCLAAVVLVWTGVAPGAAGLDPSYFSRVITHLSGLGDRSPGSSGAGESARFILEEFKGFGFKTVGRHRFSLPARTQSRARMTVYNGQEQVETAMDTFIGNAVSPGTVGEPGLTGPLVYAGDGSLESFNHKPVKGAVVLMDLDSGKNWINALSLGASALIYLCPGTPDRYAFEDKLELTPVDFPRFILGQNQARQVFGNYDAPDFQDRGFRAKVVSDLAWNLVRADNIYCLIPGTDRAFDNELIIVEGFYDTRGFVPGKAPGADQACSIATLLDLARSLSIHPPERPVLLLATAGHDNGLGGMRESVWSLVESSKNLKSMNRDLEAVQDQTARDLKFLSGIRDGASISDAFGDVKNAITDDIKTKIHNLGMRLMQLRMAEGDPATQARIRELADQRLAFRKLQGITAGGDLVPKDRELLVALIPVAIARLEIRARDAERQLAELASSRTLRKLVEGRSVQAFISLHLSSHGDGVGAFNDGWLFDLKPSVNRIPVYADLERELTRAALDIKKDPGISTRYKDTLRPDFRRSWQSFFKDGPALGGEVSALAGFPGFTLATTNDARQYWGTPSDIPAGMDLARAVDQSCFVSGLITRLGASMRLAGDQENGNGFATVRVRANFIRQGDLFADQPAPGSVLLSFQGQAMVHGMVDAFGNCLIKGVADKKHVLDKVIIEGYRFDPGTGQAIWAIDKKKTSKDGYRVKVGKASVETDLVMFQCRQTTITDVLEPRSFRYMTRLQLFDGRLDAEPVRYWYSRMDTRESTLASIFLEPGTRLKLTLSDSLLTSKLILTGSDDRHPQGRGFAIDDNPVLAPTQYLAARDMWALLGPRIDNLESKGIRDARIRDLADQGNAALGQARDYLGKMEYGLMFKAAGASLALAGRVYDHVEKTQKDVLFGVLFYIALFVPFAFCLERFLFGHKSVYRRIIAFLAILVALIALIYRIHPAFELAYSPLVVIVAFFIISLSVMVTWIVVARFEDEMKQVQRHAVQAQDTSISFFAAFTASFFMGVSNLRRRRLRTILTCTTLIILTFTIMSFTTVKNVRRHTRLDYGSQAPYHGLLVRQINWKGLPGQAADVLEAALGKGMIAAPRGWLDGETRMRSSSVPVRFQDRVVDAGGLVGLSAGETQVTGLDRTLVAGRWFTDQDRYSVMISTRMAQKLGIVDLSGKDRVTVTFWAIPFTVVGIVDGDGLDRYTDLDGESLSPVIFPDEVYQQTTDAEMDAMESGAEVKAFNTRYQHLSFNETPIIPWPTLKALGGSLKSIAFRSREPGPGLSGTVALLLDRFGLWLFAGDKGGVTLYTASDTLNYAGVPNILIPVVMAMLIVLNTMIGSVYERKREIGIYTSVGMAPSHVAILFVAEALSYAVLSVVLGYVLAQATATLFAGTGLLKGITVNYSSLSGVFAMVMVMGVVLLSSIYPSKVAASIAIPDVEASWKLSKAQGNRLTVPLPFLLGDHDVESATGWLFSYFRSHQEISHGVFSTDNLNLWFEPRQHGPVQVDPGTLCSGSQAVCRGLFPGRTDPGGDFAAKDPVQDPETMDSPPGERSISFTAWLAPFDLGIMQDVHVLFHPSPDQSGFTRVRLVILRRSGEIHTWWRVNQRFVNRVRKQLLIWRSLDPAGRERFSAIVAGHALVGPEPGEGSNVHAG
ncbi:MAG: FtsX-like permease family protein [Pseudomonadota bacterium]